MNYLTSYDAFREAIAELGELEETLLRRFNRIQFRRVRNLTATQSEWAELAGVSSATIGHWERGYRVPTRASRIKLRVACVKIKAQITDSIAARQQSLRSRHIIDPVEASVRLDHSILRAALTDFDFNEVSRRVVPVPFVGDFDSDLVEEIAEDRRNLLRSLSEQGRIIAESLKDESNISEHKLVRLLGSYVNECIREVPNARLLHRFGTTISRAINNDDFRGAANSIDTDALDGFARDHLELMRLYFKEALAHAQEVDATGTVQEIADATGEEFFEVAAIMDKARTESGDVFVDPAIPTLLRDIGSEIRDMDENILLSSDERRRAVYQRRKGEAFKNGGVYVGRFVFFAALISSVSVAGAPEIMTALSLMVGLAEAVAPGSIRLKYERLREKFQALPPLPEVRKSSEEHSKDDQQG